MSAGGLGRVLGIFFGQQRVSEMLMVNRGSWVVLMVKKMALEGLMVNRRSCNLLGNVNGQQRVLVVSMVKKRPCRA